MKVTALGVNSAFAIGKHKDVVDSEKLENLIELAVKKAKSMNSTLTLGEIKKIIRENVERAYTPKYQSNFLLEFNTKGKINDNVYRLVLDFGSDIRHSLANVGLKMTDIDGFYCSHPHADHIGGVEGIALSSIFNPFWNTKKSEWLAKIKFRRLEDSDKPFEMDSVTDRLYKKDKIPSNCKPDIWGHREVLDSLWDAARPGLDTLQGVKNVTLETYFNPIIMSKSMEYQITEEETHWNFYTVESTHVIGGTSYMPSFGLMFESEKVKIYFPTDTLYIMPPIMKPFYESADIIYHDCETGPRSGVHSHIDDIRKIDPAIKKKCFLYHYTEEPVVDEDEFMGILKLAETHTY
jgi:ribonuclease BN (tRNA processing enzyme)